MNALMLLVIHKDLALNYDQIIDDFVKKNPEKMLLVNLLGWRILITLGNVHFLQRIYVKVADAVNMLSS